MRKMKANARRWLVKSRDGWCATKTGMRPADDSTSVPTLCGHVILPYGYEQGEPDCFDCMAALKAREARK